MDIFLSKTVKAKLFTGENLKSSTSTRMIIDLFAALIINYCVLLESPLVIKKKPPKIDVAAPTMTHKSSQNRVFHPVLANI